MQEIADLEQRITAALERIDRGVAALAAPTALALGVDPTAFLPESDFAKLNEDLDEERMLTAQLNERLRVVNEKHATEIAKLSEAIALMNGALTAHKDADPAVADDQSDLIRTLRAEIDALRAARAADAAELADITAALTPLIDEAEAHA